MNTVIKSPISKVFTILLAFLFFTVTLFALEDPRIEDEKASEIHKIPLKEAMGEKAYNDAIGSGKYRYVGNSKCRLCHRKFFLGRKKDPHDHSMKVLEENGYEDNPKCLVCHATGFGTPTGFISIEKTPRLSNVQCEGCHGPGNVHIKMAKRDRHNFQAGGFLAGTDSPKILKKMCISCHNQRWDQSYHDLDKAYNKYKKADPNSKRGSRCVNDTAN